MTRLQSFHGIIGGAIALMCAVAAHANTSTYQIAGEARAVVTTGTNSISITLTDLYVNPLDIGQNLSAFYFTTSVAPSTDSISTSSATAINIASGGAYTGAGTVAPGWALTLLSGVTKLDDLGAGGAGPAHTIVGAPDGSNVYSNANSSIAHTGDPHDPFLQETATWTLTETGITSATTISDVFFQFGTTDGTNDVPGTLVATPEPEAAWMFLVAGASLILLLPSQSRSDHLPGE
jgi:hypothetical protein